MFSEKLNAVMNILEISNTQLGPEVYLDRSYISKLRSGARKLPKEPEFLTDISAYFIDVAKEKGREDVLQDLTNLPSFDDREEGVKYLTNWFTLDTGIADMVGGLLEKVPKDELSSIIEPYVGGVVNRPAEFYYGLQGKKDALLDFFADVYEAKPQVNIMWYSDEPVNWLHRDEEYLEKFKSQINRLIESGINIDIIFRDKVFTEVLNNFSFWLPVLLSGQVHPYRYGTKSDPNVHRTQIIAEGVGALISLPLFDNIDTKILIYVRDKGAVDSMVNDFKNLRALSKATVHVYDEDLANNFLGIVNKFSDAKGQIYLKSPYPSIYTLPEKIALTMSERYPDLNFAENHDFIRRTFFKALSKDIWIESIDILNFQKEEFEILYGARVLTYSRNDFIGHLNEMLRLLREHPNYHISFTDNRDLRAAMLAKEQGGVIVEKNSEPSLLFNICDEEIVEEFIDDFRRQELNANIRDKTHAIKHIEEMISFLKIKKTLWERF